MEDWEDVEVPLVLKKEDLKSKWDDEDVDENDVKDSWEDDEPAPAPAPVPAPAPAPAKAPKKTIAKAIEKKDKAAEVSEEVLLDPIAEKLRQERLVEKADFMATRDLFGKNGDDIPKSESDFAQYAELISHKLRPYESKLSGLSMTNLKGADAKEVASSVTAIANETLKAEKEATASKKKTGAKKKQLLVDKPDDEVAVGAYDGYDDYDFM